MRTNDSFSGYLIKKVNYTDSTTIYCLVDSSRFHYTDGINIFYKYITFIYKSTDGGKSWTIYPTQDNLNLRKRPSVFLQMKDSLHGILAQLPDTLENYDRILLTSDGWQTYKEVKTNKFYFSINGFYSPPVVALFTNPRDFWVSRDDGKTWDTLSFPDFAKKARMVYFANDSLWLFSGYNKANNSKVVLKSKDFGVSWDTLFALPSLDTNSYLPLNGPFNGNRFTTIINSQYAYTDDNGKSWKFITPATY
ncbi:MAG: WD40/YVTN/BNR-like repeat-containing protein, partial [Candidatus Kapaibacteriota bacterium]